MSLKEYARKRTFSRTPEPPPAKKQAKTAKGRKPVFVVQRHHARRLHYDFRLKLGGTLKSWAIPKGPSLDPAVKRLAVHVEDHPMDYGSFEGNIPAGEYGGGSVMVWDRGTYEVLGGDPADAQYRRGDFKFRLHGEKLRGEFVLVRTKGRGDNQWLLIKKRDAEAVTGWDAEEYSRSALSGRSQEEIAKGEGPIWHSKKDGAKAVVTNTQKAEKAVRAKEARQAKSASATDRRASARTASEKRIDPAKLPGAVAAAMPASVTPMLSTLADAPPEGDDWVYEIKWDGMRVLLFLDGGRVRLVSRRGNDCARQFPELTAAQQSLAAQQAIVDGEVVVLDERGRPSFSLLQPRMMASDAGAIAHMARSRPIVFCVFDLLYLDGYDLRKAPLVERKRALQTIVNSNSLIRYSEHFAGSGPGSGKDFLEAARAQELEGIVAKRAASRYESRRTSNWVKVKISAQQEFVICGFTEGERDTFGSLVLGLYDKGELVYVGNVGTGFDTQMLRSLFDKLSLLATSRSPFPKPIKMPKPLPVTWVRPELVCTVKFHSWTPDGRLRAPVFLGLRPDVEPSDCVKSGGGASSVAQPESVPRTESSFLAGTAATLLVNVDGKQLKFTNLNKVFYPREGYTKRDVIRYYDAVAPLLLPHLKDRPLSLRRYPDGVEGESFFQKDARADFPSWLRTERIATEDSTKGRTSIRFVVADDRATLLYLANLACIDQNPWMSRAIPGDKHSLEHPDFILIDLDPQDSGYDRVVEAAQLVRQKLELLELEGYPKTTGGKGMHIYVPVEPIYTYEQTRAFAEILARWVADERPDLFTTPRPVARREKGKVYFDYLQNGYGKTISAPYVLRAHHGAPVATPLAWHEVVPGLLPTKFHIRNVLDRFANLGDLFRAVLEKPQRMEEALEKLAVHMNHAS